MKNIPNNCKQKENNLSLKTQTRKEATKYQKKRVFWEEKKYKTFQIKNKTKTKLNH